jgi:hypothetical protein
MKSRPPLKRRDSTESPSPFRYRGLWRDEKLLVVDLADHHFPRRCLKTNQVVEQLEPLTLTYYGPSSAERQMLSGLQFEKVQINVIEERKSGSRALFTLPVPLSPRLRTIWHSPWGQRLIWIGLGVLVTAFFIASWHRDFAIVFMALGMISILVGIAYLIAQRWTLPVHRVCEGKIWIGGVHRDWLERLPKFVPSRTMLAEEIWLLHGSLWTCIWFGVFVLGLFLAGRFSGELLNKDGHYFGGAVLTIVAVAILIGNRARMLLQTARQKLAALDPPPMRRKRRR